MENSFVEDLFLEADKPTPSTEPKTAGTVGGAGIGEIRHEPDSGSKRQNVRAYPAETGGSTPPRSVPASEYAGEKQSKTKKIL
jgi:hypothetical protein